MSPEQNLQPIPRALGALGMVVSSYRTQFYGALNYNERNSYLHNLIGCLWRNDEHGEGPGCSQLTYEH